MKGQGSRDVYIKSPSVPVMSMHAYTVKQSEYARLNDRSAFTSR